MSETANCSVCGGLFERPEWQVRARRYLCAACRKKQRTPGAPKPKARRRYRPAEALFWGFVRRGDGCWLWLGPDDSHGRGGGAGGYGRFSHGRKRLLAHRVAYELAVGPIPEGLTLDHLCMNKRCVNPSHLEPVTAAENTRRYLRAKRSAA